jgi:MFS family permease
MLLVEVSWETYLPQRTEQLPWRSTLSVPLLVGLTPFVVACVALTQARGAPAIGPAIGGFMAETVGWKWIFILVSGLSGLASVAGILVYRETYSPVILLRITEKKKPTKEMLRENPQLAQTHGDRLNYLFTNLKRPFMLLTRSIVCFMLSAYMALYVLFKLSPHASLTLSAVCMVSPSPSNVLP